MTVRGERARLSRAIPIAFGIGAFLPGSFACQPFMRQGLRPL